MSFKSLLPDSVSHYANALMSPEPAILQRLRARTMLLPNGDMQISPDQGRLLAILVRIAAPKSAIEIGTFTGTSALVIASALPPASRLTCLDLSAEWTSIGQSYWQEAGVAGRITLRLGPALDSLAALAQDRAAFDFAFVDADKIAYDAYYEALLPLMPTGGLLIFDNMLRHGAVAEPDPKVDEASRRVPTEQAGTAAIRALSQKIRDDPRVDSAFLTVGDGFHIARKK